MVCSIEYPLMHFGKQYNKIHLFASKQFCNVIGLSRVESEWDKSVLEYNGGHVMQLASKIEKIEDTGST